VTLLYFRTRSMFQLCVMGALMQPTVMEIRNLLKSPISSIAPILVVVCKRIWFRRRYEFRLSQKEAEMALTTIFNF
jgi:hypothetical protein